MVVKFQLVCRPANLTVNTLRGGLLVELWLFNRTEIWCP